MYHLIIGSINIEIVNWASAPLWDFLKWKLDQFYVHGEERNIICIEIQNCISEKFVVSQEQYKILFKEKCGFFDWIVARSPSGDLLYSLVRRSKDSIYLLYRVQENGKKILLLEDKTESNGQAAFEYIGRIIPGIFLQHRMLTFHGVLMEYDGKGIIISADSGTGKTTHARLWRDSRNALIINGDRAVCQKMDNTWIGIGTPWSGTSGEQINRQVIIQAVVVLERDKKNEAKHITGMEAFGALLPQIQYPSWDAELAEKMMELLEDFLTEIPIIRLKCLPDLDAVNTLERMLEEL